MMLRFLRPGLLLTGLALLVVCGCSRKIREYKPGAVYSPKETVARVNGHKMTWDQMEKRAQNFLKNDVDAKELFIPQGGEEKAMDFYRRKVMTMFINKTILIGEADKLGVKVTEADRQKFVPEMENEIKKRGLASSLDDFFKKSPIGENETRQDFEDGLLVDKFIQENIKNKLKIVDKDRELLANDIIAKRREAKQKADELRAQLLRGADFASMVKELSSGPDKRIMSGDLGEIIRGKLGDKQIEDAIFSQKVNELGPLLDTARGYLLLRVTARTAAKAASGATPATPETVRASFINVRTPPKLNSKEMDDIILKRKFGLEMSELLKSLQAKAKIETIYKDLML